jgi:hypothetical protein
LRKVQVYSKKSKSTPRGVRDGSCGWRFEIEVLAHSHNTELARRFKREFYFPSLANLFREMREEMVWLASLEDVQSCRPAPIITSLGNRIYRVGDGLPVQVSEKENRLLQAFINAPALKSEALIQRSKDCNAVKTLKSLRKNYTGYFADAIQCPGGKDGIGYQAVVRDQEE